MSLTKRDRKFPTRATGQDEDSRRFAAAMAAALHETFGGGGSAIKTVARLTSANDRTVKNWFAGKNGPRGDHLVKLVAQSNGILHALLMMAGRVDLLAIAGVVDIKQRMTIVMNALDKFMDGK